MTPVAAVRPAQVLIADNDPGVRALLAEVVRRQGLGVQVADDGEAARRLLETHAFDVLVCDLDMPRLTGAQLIAWLRQLPTQPRVLVVSGYVEARLADEWRALPFVHAVLKKPFDILAFAQLVRAAASPASGTGEVGAAS